ncbi:MAG TPA: class I tRNA ligase family protein, partial [Actinomycetota bacterium]|nr:class I tRNA ligase family protein [Actinomycetota bacterium]
MRLILFEKVNSNSELPTGERDILDHWERSRTFDALRAKVAGGPRWSFLDGPITANNPMGVHHAWGRTYKDAFQRFFAMTGHDQRFQNGFDCQGLWVEVQVEKELGFTSKRDIEAFGLERFIDLCKERVRKYSAIQTEQSIRLGMWMDWDNSYYTMSDENNYTIWSFLKRCHERGLIYKGLDAMPWCPRCGTGISEQERKEGYVPVTDRSVYVRLPLRERPSEYLLVWTTTPWTLAANVAAAVNPELTYVKVRQGDDIYYLSKGRVDVLKSESKVRGKPEVLAEMKGADLVGWTYDGPYDDLPAAREASLAHRIIPWDGVEESSGTGIVHIAPGCGKEDFDLGRQLQLPTVAPIDEEGVYVAGFGPLTGLSALDVSEQVFGHLKEKSLYYKIEPYEHDYPHCWRCGTALLFRAVDEWYINLDWRDEIRKVVDQITWIPDYGRELELDWLRNMGDWMISKKRYWGLALPIFECDECGWFDVIGNREELEARAVQGWEQFQGDPDSPNSPHRPWVDAIRIECGNCGALASRIPDVGNPWLDAGIVPYSTVGYNSDRGYWARWIPADFIVESFPGQFRNWFYSLLAMSTMMENIAPFKTLLGYALVRDEQGDEMHKSKGNSIEFNAAADEVGADVMRWLFCRHNPTLNLNFGYTSAHQIERKTFGTLWNSYLFFTNYAILDEFDPTSPQIPPQDRPEIDRWILSNLQLLIQTAHLSLTNYSTYQFVREAEQFIDDLSN